jgi:hypothetical protein
VKPAEHAITQPSGGLTPRRIFLLGASPALGSSASAAEPDDTTRLSSVEKLRRAGGNTGNQVIAFGLLKTVKFDAVSWDYAIGPERVNDEYDLILIAAANFIHSGFDLGGMASFIEATRLPCAMVGVGAQSNDYSTNIALKPGTERLLRVVAERSQLIGARGTFTAEVLAGMGINNVQVTGCPSYYMNCKPELRIRKPSLPADPQLLINSSRDVVSHSFNREQMIAVVCKLLALAVERNADFIAQSELPEINIADSTNPDEIEVIFRKILTEFPFYGKVAPYESLLAWFRNHGRVFWDVNAWFSEMRKYDFVFGNRFHGNMIALQAGTPACVICHDTRTSEMCEFLGLPFIGLGDLDKISVEFLYSLVDPDAIQSRYQQLYPHYKAFLGRNGLETTLE